MPRPTEPAEPSPHGDGSGGAAPGGAAPGGDVAEAEVGAAHTPVRVITIPSSLRDVDVSVGARAVRGLLVLALVVLGVLGGRWWWVQQGAEGVPVDSVARAEGGVAGADGAHASGPVTAPPSGPASTEPSDLAAAAPGGPANVAPGVVVHVIGEVGRPGVVELPAGARVGDAISAAGGFTEGADPTLLNLARTLVDGEQVWAGAPGEDPPPGVILGQDRAGGSVPAGGSAPSGGGNAAPLLVDLNTATQAELEELPGIGPVTAGKIMAFRDEHGGFTAVEELMEVSGIGERTFAELEPLVAVTGSGGGRR